MIRNKSASILAVVIFALFLAAGCALIPRETKTAEPANTKETQSENVAARSSERLPFGNPSNAGLKDRNNYLLIKTASAISYNNSRGTANWIQWKTTKEMLGNSLPRPDFEPDMDLPKGFRRITTRDYIGTGFQRGHLVPSADRFGDREANAETFLMTNIVPQVGALNEHPWQKLESEVRSEVRKTRNGGYDAYQIAGVYGEQSILKGKVTVPTNCWKIIAFVRRGDLPESIGGRTRIIAVDMPNIKGIENKPWETYITTIRDIEEKTGLDFFNWLPKAEQDQIETQIEMSNKNGRTYTNP